LIKIIYIKDSWKNEKDVIELLLTCAESGGNLLINVGPKADGTIPEESVSILQKAGTWIKHNFKSITNSERHPFSWNCTARPITFKENKIFLHFILDPCGEFCWGELKNKVTKAYFLTTGKEVEFQQKENRLFLKNLPIPLSDNPATTIVLEIEGNPEALTNQTTFWIPE
jgi:alpha-L-fucosidase